MALKIRLTRLGDKGNPFYRVVVTEHQSPRDGKFIGVLGTYDPKAKDKEAGIKIDREIAMEWIAKGATPTDTAYMVLVKAGILKNEKPVKKISKPKATAPKNKKEKK
ncbi:MAG: 30S ribosomal protein S16 [Christensenellaceae bacterium]|jgi:small subunit ribosomal protein S16|nr:30S ribosomal protein S16 [Christensenellaceae bacterium]